MELEGYHRLKEEAMMFWGSGIPMENFRDLSFVICVEGGVQNFLLEYMLRYSVKVPVYVYHGEQISFGWAILVQTIKDVLS